MVRTIVTTHDRKTKPFDAIVTVMIIEILCLNKWPSEFFLTSCPQNQAILSPERETQEHLVNYILSLSTYFGCSQQLLFISLVLLRISLC